MITINENNITVDFLKSDLVHIALEQEAHFSTQLMRELRAVSKINNGETVKNCIISNNKDFGNEADWCRICKKADHMKEFMTVAVVCNNSCAVSSLKENDEITETDSPKVFHNYSEALSWANKQKTI
ncbi:MAG: hypothetical protein IPO32_18575 [Crocinitomicaceae bacterium]|nr:hypothetical protein [Crocinitomicaceae bacterium]